MDDGIAIARVWVAAWRAAYAGVMPAEYLAGLDAQACLPGGMRFGIVAHLRPMKGSRE